ncbi:kinase-like domain-containing protein, partial [Scleroderma citrinum]
MSLSPIAFDYPSPYPCITESLVSSSAAEGHSFDHVHISWRGSSSDPSFPLAGDPYDIPVDDSSTPDLTRDLPNDPWTTHDAAIPEPAGLSPAALFLSAFSPPTTHARLPDDEGESVAGYVLGPIIGHGGFSTIRRASSPNGGIVAIKIVKRSEISRQENPSLTRRRLDHETQIWASLSHEHILPLFTAEHSSYADFFVMPYCPAGSLYDILRRDGNPGLPLDDAGMMFRQVVRGVRYLHEVAGYVHRDIKLENVLVDEMGVCRIADFGLARKIGELDEEEGDMDRHRSTISHSRRRLHPSRTTRHPGPRRHRVSTPVGDDARTGVHGFPAGSLPYAAPELLSPSSSGRYIRAHPAHDMWALGILLYALLTGRLPFTDSFEPRLTMKILHGTSLSSFEIPKDIGRGAERVLKGCLERSMGRRWTIAMVDDAAWGIGCGEANDLACSEDHD